MDHVRGWSKNTSRLPHVFWWSVDLDTPVKTNALIDPVVK